jgi:glycerophosphoryl diester phosphodiesterase
MAYIELMAPGLDGRTPVAVLAHRGGLGPWQENTVAAFSGAVAAGADGVELDVRLSADGVLVVHHDPHLPGGNVCDLGFSDMPAYVPRLVEALEACPGAIVNIEIKNSPLEAGYDPHETVALEVPEVLARLSAAGTGPRQVVVSSFSPASIQALREVSPDTPSGLLVHPSLDADSGLDVAAGMGCAALHPHHVQVTEALVTRAHGLGLAVVTWTVNEPSELESVMAAGVDAVITDQVGRVLGGLGRR